MKTYFVIKKTAGYQEEVVATSDDSEEIQNEYEYYKREANNSSFKTVVFIAEEIGQFTAN